VKLIYKRLLSICTKPSYTRSTVNLGHVTCSTVLLFVSEPW